MKGILLIVGAGSIGRRHTQNARTLGIRTIVCDVDIKRAKKLAEETDSEKFYADYKKACEENTDISATVIATPSQYHIENAKFLAKKGIHVFIEKPLASEIKGIDELIDIINSKNIVAMMGQSYRFHEGYLALEKLLKDGVIGKVYHSNLFGGQYLPDWHPTMDYRMEYAAQKKLGGGALLTSMSHVFDSVEWLFGEINELSGWKAKLSDLEMDVDDSVFCLMKTDHDIVVMCQTDFLQRVSKHRMVVVGERGTIEADFVTHEITIELPREKTRVQKYSFEPNKKYLEELEHFVELVKDGVMKHPLDIYTGKRVVELLLSDKMKAITEI
ncbi:MAG: Gfo/Idh/MocA family oxidoreductase [Candidatus Yonathbacteria bacterium]|nr:Gfo/Idh/MocA family oxidoreductase [Candidatus Yonathbacteria bacterium]